jgi:hypothetical protein
MRRSFVVIVLYIHEMKGLVVFILLIFFFVAHDNERSRIEIWNILDKYT